MMTRSNGLQKLFISSVCFNAIAILHRGVCVWRHAPTGAKRPTENTEMIVMHYNDLIVCTVCVAD